MSKETPQSEQPPKKLSPEQFSHVCDSLVDYQISPDLFNYVNEALENNRFVAFLLTHQSYFDIEVCRYICEHVNQGRENPINLFLEYSSPAVGKNIGNLLVKRKEIYDNCHLIMLGVVRGSDKKHEKYKDLITQKMIDESDVNDKLYNEKTSQGRCIAFIPFEATLHSGRINKETGKRNGMKKVTNNPKLIQAIRQKAIIVPFGIDGSYKIVDAEEHELSNLFYEAIFTKNPKKVVTAKIGQPIDLLLPEYKGIPTRELYERVTLKVAGLVSREAQGDYQQYLAV